MRWPSAPTSRRTRLLHYYEEQGLLAPGRTPNGYRGYPERLLNRIV
ncbi:MerR family DNA-binding transcriptional regulator [Actinoallomurus bryophytorum]